MKTTNLLDLINYFLRNTFNQATELDALSLEAIITHVKDGNLVKATKLLRTTTEIRFGIDTDLAFNKYDENVFNDWIRYKQLSLEKVEVLPLRPAFHIIKFIDRMQHEL